MTDTNQFGTIVVKWHRQFFGREDGASRAAKARLKRCNSAVEALSVVETHELNAMLKDSNISVNADQLALIATTFSRLTALDGNQLAQQFGSRSRKDDPRKLSELRFQSLIRIKAHRELVAPLRRATAVLGTDIACNAFRLADDLYYWNDDVRRNWCFQYFGSGNSSLNKEGT